MSPPDPLPSRAADEQAFDLILVGGGLANALIAWRLRQRRPELRLCVLEQGPTLGGNHTWSFHASDLAAAEFDWMAPLVSHRWPGHEVRFPGLNRQLPTPYCSVASRHLHDTLAPVLADALQLNTRATSLGQTQVQLHDGRVLQAAAVIDGRGPRAFDALELGYQGFVGWEMRTAQPHGLRLPILMDAQVPQDDGYRFMYVLPLSEDSLLVEDTCYSDGPALDRARSRARIAQYAQRHGWHMQTLLREEEGVLPILLDGDFGALWQDRGAATPVGLAAALFHPTTGYSLPQAVRLAWTLAGLPVLNAATLRDAVHGHAQAHWQTGAFFRLLNRMLFRAAAPAQRRRVMERFYGLNAGLIERFYAGAPRLSDRARILCGRPPVPLLAAARAAFGRARPLPHASSASSS